ncbi:TIR domain-containing protein [Ferribacterium limneticum]|uniref:hypothetical protein n=1 Tax=Ferribacterium limneticum TaxID=76259 RepID=UPI001CF7EFED|nr:hypothetical protein [Ferribacterium limneticum]UCV21660.1 hypothetical protein KI613_14060 [Ferribacterium limneticum]
MPLTTEKTVVTETIDAMKRPFSECRYYAFFSYSEGDNRAWNKWVSCFKDELYYSLPGRLRGIRLPPIHHSGEYPLVSGLLDGKLKDNVRDTFVLFLFVHDNYLDSGWCLKELEHFKEHFGDDGFRERLYVIAMSKNAIDELTKGDMWKRLCPFNDQLWVPFYQAAKPKQPIQIYSGEDDDAEGKHRVVSNTFWKAFVDIREDLADKILDAVARSKTADVASQTEDPEMVRIYIETNERQDEYKGPLAAQVYISWDQVVASDHVEPTLRVRPTGLPMKEINDRPYLDDADGVVLLWDEKTSASLLAQITAVEDKLRGKTPIPGIIAYPMKNGAPAPEEAHVQNWQVLKFEPDAQGGLRIADQDSLALVIFLTKVLERKRQRLLAGKFAGEAAK